VIYFDNNATTRVAPEVLDAMMPFLTASYGNPSSAYPFGRESRAAVEKARESVAGLLGAAYPEEIVFTSGGTESDNWAILAAFKANPGKRNQIITTRVEHEAVRKLCEGLGNRAEMRVTWLDVDENGALYLDQLRTALDESTAIVSVMMANNETGILFPIAEIAEIVKTHSNAFFHVDGVNAVGKVPVSLEESGIDLFSLSGHKFHGPKGIGALYLRRGFNPMPMYAGGGQEMGRRPGTEAVHQIVGMGAAAEFVKDMVPMERVRTLRERLESKILDACPNSRINGTADPSHRLPNTSSISFENTNGEMILARLADLGVCVSTGSACNSDDHTASPVLQAMNIPYSRAMGAIRFSLGRFNTEEEIDFVIEHLPGIVAELYSLAN
jgi:cysteine desulfurase